MRARVAIVAMAVAAGVVAGAVVSLDRGGIREAYAALRQQRPEEVPGTWGLVLGPPPSGFVPAVDPARARRIAVPNAPPGDRAVVLATVPAAFGGDVGPVWAVIVRGLCFASEKGEVVSASRSLGVAADRCSDKNLWVALVDARSGRAIASVGGYDDSERWSPAIGTS